jgi:predicted outer membrane repeat protein
MLRRFSMKTQGVPTAAALALASLVGAPMLSAATYTVCATGSPDFGTLSAAIVAAAPGDVLSLCAGVHTASGAVIDRELTLQGAGQGVTILEPASPGTLILSVINAGPVTIRDLTFRNASNADVNGGALLADNASDLLIERVTFSSNANTEPTGQGVGGGLALLGTTATLRDVNLLQNQAASGGALYCGGCVVDVEGAMLAGNTATAAGLGGGAALVVGGTLTLERSTVSNNLSAGNGGGVHNYLGLTFVNNSTLNGNTAVGNDVCCGAGGGALANGDILFVSNSTLSGNGTSASGGGILTQGSGGSGIITKALANQMARAEKLLGRRQVPAPNAPLPGFLESTVVNATLAGNNASVAGGGIANRGALTVMNSIVSGSTGGDCALASAIGVNATPNLASDGSCTGFTLAGTDPDLEALDNNGGATFTHKPREGSPALDAGSDAVCAADPVNAADQRGMARPQRAQCDLGAYEKEPATNEPPDCKGVANIPVLWPATGALVEVEVIGVTDPDGDPVTVIADAVYQDESVKTGTPTITCPDGQLTGGPTAFVRAERNASKNGRVYHVFYTAYDDKGAFCKGDVIISVPRTVPGRPATDDAPRFDSTVCR